ncbi:MAG: hypothetical protein AAF789_15160, partial [Bacteroidota bacterium]
TLREDENGVLYVHPVQNSNMLNLEYFNLDPTQVPPPNTLLRFNDDGTFDPSFSFDYGEVLDIELFNVTSFIFNDKAVVIYWDSNDNQLPPSFDDWAAWRSNPNRSVSIDLTTKVVEPFDALDKYFFAAAQFNIEGVPYFRAGSTDSQGNLITYFLRQDGFDQFTEVGIYEGDVVVGSLGKLW